MASTRRRRRWLLLPAGIGVGLWALQSDGVSRFAARTLEAAASRALGERVTIGRIDLSYLPPHVELDGVVVTHEATGETIVAAKAIRLEPGFEGLRPVLEKLDLDRPEVSLHLDTDGLREFRVKPGGGGGSPSRTFPWKHILIHDGRFSLQGAGLDLDLRGIEAEPAAGDGPSPTNLRVGELDIASGGVTQRATDLVFPGVTLAPDRFAVPAFDLRFDAGRLSGHLSAIRDGLLDGDVSVHADLPRLTRRPDRKGYEDGAVDLDVSLGGTASHPEVSGAIAWAGLVLWRGDPPKALRIGDAAATWRLLLGDDSPKPGDPVLAVDHLGMTWGGGAIDANAQVDLRDKTIEGGVLAEDVSLAGIFRAIGTSPAPWVDLHGDVETHVSGTLSPLAMKGPFEVDVDRFRVNSGPLEGYPNGRPSTNILAMDAGSVQGGLEFDADHLVLDADVASGRSRGHARADIGFHNTLSIDADLPRLDLGTLKPLGDARLGGLAEVHGWLGGRYDTGLSAHATVNGSKVVVLGFPVADTMTTKLESPDLKRLHFTDIAATLGASRYRGDFLLAFTDPMFLDTQLYVADGRVRDFTGIFVDLGDLDAKVSGSAVLSGAPYNLDGEVDLKLSDIDIYGERFAEGHATSWMDDGELTIDELAVKRGDENVLLRGSVKRGYRLNLDLLSDGFAIDRLDHLRPLGLPVTGDVTLDAQIGGTLFEPEPRGRIATRHVYYGAEHLDDSAVAFHTANGTLGFDGHLLGTALGVRGHLGLWGPEKPYAVDADFASFPAHFLFPRGEDGSPIHAGLSGSLALSGLLGDHPTPVDVDAHFDAVSASWSGHVLSAPEPWVFSVHDRKVDVRSLKLRGDDGTSVSFQGFADKGGQLAFSGSGRVDIDLARIFVPGLQEARGLALVDLQVDRAALPSVFGETPKPDAPATRVNVQLKDGSIRGTWFPAEFDGVSATVKAGADGYEIDDVSAKVGGGTFKAPHGTITAKDWWPTRFDLAGTVHDAEVKYLDYLPPMTGDADLRFDGPTSDLLLSGNIRLSRMDFRDRIDWESTVISLREEHLTGSAPEDRTRWFGMDLDVTADDTVHVHNNIAEADASARLRIIGDTQRPGMVGEIRVAPGGHMYLHDHEFDISRAEIRYVDPYTYDPDLDIQLETDVKSYDQDYQIGYQVTGPFSDWTTSTSSDPWLSQADINALLLFGVTREELERYGAPVLGSALVAETSDLLLAQTALNRLDMLVDRWSLVSGVDERGSAAVSSELRLVAQKQLGDWDFTVEKALGQGLGTDWYASIERRIAERMYATAYIATRQEGRSLPIGGAYGAEFKLRWELD